MLSRTFLKERGKNGAPAPEVSHPFARKKANGWGTEVNSKAGPSTAVAAATFAQDDICLAIDSVDTQHIDAASS